MLLEKGKKYKVILSNTAYLSVLEVLKMVMPFIALPYIISTVGTENYGLVVFAQTVISYFIVLVNFGLDVSAVKEVSVARKDISKLNEIVSSVLMIKTILFLISFVILGGMVLLIDQFRSHVLLFFLSFLSCLSEILFPVWFYQGIEKMKYITLIRFISILIYTVTVFLFIKRADDYILVPLLQSIGWIVSGVVSFFMLLKAEKITLFLPSLNLMKKYFVDSIPFFFSRVSVVINNGMAKLVCGIFFTMHEVAALDLAQKIATTALVPLQMLNQAIFPHIAKTKDVNFVNKCFRMIMFATLCIIFLVYVLAPLGIHILSGGALMDSVPLLRILCLFIFSGGITLYTGSPVLVSFGYSKPFNRSVLLSTVILICLYGLLFITNKFSIEYFTLALGLAEFSIAIYRLYYCNRYKLIQFNGRIKPF